MTKPGIEEISVSVPATHAELTLVGRYCMKNSVCALVLTGYNAGFGFGAVKWWIALLSNMMMGLTDQWHRVGCNAVLLKGEGGGNGGNVEEVCVCSICESRPPLHRQWWICHRSSRLLHSPTVMAPTDGNYQPCPLSAPSDLSILLGYSDWPCRCCRRDPETCMDDLQKNQWAMNTHVSTPNQGFVPYIAWQYWSVSGAEKLLQGTWKDVFLTV